MEKLNIQYMSLDELKEYKANPRDNEKAVEKVAKSIEEFGFKVPIVVDGKNEIIAGHTRLKASRRLGLDEVPVIVAEDLSEKQIKAFRIADNKVSEQSTWEKSLLKLELEDLEEEFTGFDDDELADLFDDEEEEEEEEPEIEFTEELGEENNYLVLKFDNSVDWLQAQTIFGLKSVHSLDSRKGFEKKGVGRVIDGTEFMQKMLEGERS